MNKFEYTFHISTLILMGLGCFVIGAICVACVMSPGPRYAEWDD